jgi:hypothetical protein
LDDIDDSGDDENAVSVNDLLAQAAKDPNSDGNTSDVDEELGSPLSAGSALAPANTTYRNTLLGIFHDTAQAARDRLSAQEDEPDDRRVDQADPTLTQTSPSLPLPPMSGTSSQTTMMMRSHLGQHSSNDDPNPDDLTYPTSSAGINSNGKHPYSQLSVHDKENLEHPLPPVHVPNKRVRGGGQTRGGHHKK